MDMDLTQALGIILQRFDETYISNAPLYVSGSFAVINCYGLLNHIGRHMNRYDFLPA